MRSRNSVRAYIKLDQRNNTETKEFLPLPSALRDPVYKGGELAFGGLDLALKFLFLSGAAGYWSLAASSLRRLHSFAPFLAAPELSFMARPPLSVSPLCH